MSTHSHPAFARIQSVSNADPVKVSTQPVDRHRLARRSWTWRSSSGPIYLDGYSDEPDAIDSDGNVHVPDALGLGVRLDWDYIEKHRTARAVFE